MNGFLHSPLIAFLIYFLLIALFSGIGRLRGRQETQVSAKSSTYAGGEAGPVRMAAPGYRPFFVVALFFAILHLGVLILGSGGLSLSSGAFLIGLMLALLALILG